MKKREYKITCTNCKSVNSHEDDGGYFNWNSLSGTQVCWYCKKLFRFYIKNPDFEFRDVLKKRYDI